MSHRTHTPLTAALCLAGLLLVPSIEAGDWPQILGPARNGEAKGESLQAWGETGPRKLWSAELGQGYAGAAVAGERVIAFHRQGDQELLVAFNAADGKQVWQANFPAGYRGGYNSDRGPRCVPIIHDRRVYGFGAAGQLHCVSLASGRPIWSRNLYKEYRGLEGYFGAGSTPVVADGVLLVNVGGRDDAGLVALSPKTGKTLWKKGRDNASYSAPTTYTEDGKTRVVFITRLHCVGLEPATGNELFRFRFGQTGATVNAATPLVFDGSLFVSASYGIGAQLMKLGAPPTEVWSNNESMSSQYTTCVHRRGFLYGVHGREDEGSGSLRCIEAATGRVKWDEPTIGVAHVILAGEHLLVQEVGSEGGGKCRLSLIKASPEQCEVLAQHVVGPGSWRALPALSAGRLYLRRTAGPNSELQCLEVGE